MAKLDLKYLAELVLQAQEGDSDAFAELYVATYQQQYRFSYRYLRDTFLAQDALQETYIMALKDITTLRDPNVFLSWLNQINMRVCFDIYCKENRKETGIDHHQYTQGAQYVGKFSLEGRGMAMDEKAFLSTRIMNLPFSESQAIQLRYFRNMSVPEIADMMQTSQSAVKRYLRNAQKKLAK